jgi:hypothetical protein
MNRDDPQSLSRTLPLLLSRPAAERATGEMRGWLSNLPQPVECVWSGRSLAQAFDVDHAIPYTVWGNNDLWNLLPCDPKLNRGKNGTFAKLPTQALLQARRAPDLHRETIRRALACEPSASGWEAQAFSGLQSAIERLATARGLPRWEP